MAATFGHTIPPNWVASGLGRASYKGARKKTGLPGKDQRSCPIKGPFSAILGHSRPFSAILGHSRLFSAFYCCWWGYSVNVFFMSTHNKTDQNSQELVTRRGFWVAEVYIHSQVGLPWIWAQNHGQQMQENIRETTSVSPQIGADALKGRKYEGMLQNAGKGSYQASQKASQNSMGSTHKTHSGRAKGPKIARKSRVFCFKCSASSHKETLKSSQGCITHGIAQQFIN